MTANQEYKRSGSKIPFKDWLEEQRANFQGIMDPELSKRIAVVAEQSTNKIYNTQDNSRPLPFRVLGIRAEFWGIAIGIIGIAMLYKSSKS